MNDDNQEMGKLAKRVKSLGGVVWVEVLSRHSDWWYCFKSMMLLGSPIGGADAARIVDPFGWGIGMAKHLGTNRRPMAETITAVIPPLVVASNFTGGEDGLVSIEATVSALIEHFRSVLGITDASERDFPMAHTVFSFADGTSIWTWRNWVGVEPVFVANPQGKCEYAAFVGWVHTSERQKAIAKAIRGCKTEVRASSQTEGIS